MASFSTCVVQNISLHRAYIVKLDFTVSVVDEADCLFHSCPKSRRWFAF